LIKLITAFGILSLALLSLNPVYALDTDIGLVYESDETLDLIVQSCFANPSTNVIQNLIDSGVISSAFSGQTCQSIQVEKNSREIGQDAAESVNDLLDMVD
jgi:hypothetical protein